MKLGSKPVATTQTAPPSEAPRAMRPIQPASTVPAGNVESLEAKVCNPKRYWIRGEHGRGARGRVSRAHDRNLGRDIAIKELISRGALNEARFMREALITARLEHPGIVPVYEAGYWPDGTPFYAMKLVAGRSLRDLFIECKTLDERIPLLHHVIAVADAIAYAHDRNVIHRDLKPANVIVGDFGETVVIDWGLAKDLTVDEEPSVNDEPLRIVRGDDLTVTGSVIGTPAYMPPEQRRGEAVDQRADVFAIGAMLWELCALQRTPPASRTQRRHILRRAGIEHDLVAIIDKALHHDAAGRYRDAGTLAADLKAFKSGARVGARNYSLYAILVHWTRRHRALALSMTAAVVLAVTGVVMYLRNVAVERDRADAALYDARRERDRAKLSEAAQLLENDPIRARELLASLTQRSPQYALLTARMQQLSADKVIPVAGIVDSLIRAPESGTVGFQTRDGGFHRLQPASGKVETVDHDLVGPVAYRAGQWLYARRTGTGSIQIAKPGQPSPFDIPLHSVSRVVALTDAVYALDGEYNLHRFDSNSATVVDHDVGNVVGDDNTRLVCKLTGELAIMHKNVVVYRGRCPSTLSPFTMAAVHDDYVALTADHVLIASRNGRQVEIQTPIRAEYELALSGTGLIAISDYEPPGTSWFVRPGGNTLEAGPLHGATPYCVAADGNLAGWGYVDGTVIVRDTATGTVWPLHGQSGSVYAIVIDAAHARVVTASLHELRVWELKQPAEKLISSMPCRIYHVQASPNGHQAALDCNDGTVRLWSRDAGTVLPVHSHVGQTNEVQWLDGRICSVGFIDGHIMCSRPDGSAPQVIDSGPERITWLAAGPAHNFLIYATSEGGVWRFDGGKPVQLYTHSSLYRLAVSNDGTMLGSCGLDGTVAVYDLTARRLIAHGRDHIGATYNISWVDDELWTSGDDSVMKRWAVRKGNLVLRHTLITPGAVYLMKARGGVWAIKSGDTALIVGRDGSSVELRLELGRPIEAIDVSADARYVAAGINGEIVVVDLQRNAIASVTAGSPWPRSLCFLDAVTLAFSESRALKTLAVDHLHYVAFSP